MDQVIEIFDELIDCMRELYGVPNGILPLHTPVFSGNEKKYLLDVIDSTYVSSVGVYVDRFEEMMTRVTGAKHAIATVNGTSAIHLSLLLSGVKEGDLVITQSFSFVATSNAIRYLGAMPLFLDVDKSNMGLSPVALNDYLENATFRDDDGVLKDSETGRRIAACLPVHIYGFPCQIDLISATCKDYNIPVIEDAAEAIGSRYKGAHVGADSEFAIFSFNGNKTITCGGGGVIVTNNAILAEKARHLSTTAKTPYQWEHRHDAVGYNYRMPNINAALACAQLEILDRLLASKRRVARTYADFFKDKSIYHVYDLKDADPNYWLNCILLENKEERDYFLQYSNGREVMTRPAWTLLNTFPMYKDAPAFCLKNSEYLSSHMLCLPSSPVLSEGPRVSSV